MAAPSAFGGPTDAGAARLVGLSVALLALLVAESSRGLVVSSMYTFIKDVSRMRDFTHGRRLWSGAARQPLPRRLTASEGGVAGIADCQMCSCH